MNTNRKIKDSVFTKVFGETSYAFKLYKVFHPEDVTATEDQLRIITLENIFTNGIYNDLGLIMNNRLMLFVEAQSTWNPNMPIRALLYLAETYKRYFIEREIDILSSGHIDVPVPEVYVIFTGERADMPQIMRFSEHFDKSFNFGENSLELTVKMIYDSKEGDVVYQYINFCKVFDEQKVLYKNDKHRAIMETLRICADKALLDSYIKEHEGEVYDIMSDYIFNDEVLMRIHIASEKRISRQEGAHNKAVETARKMLSDGLSVDMIVKYIGLSLEEVTALQAELTQTAQFLNIKC